MNTLIMLGAMIGVSVWLLLMALKPRKENQQDTVRRRMTGRQSKDDKAAIQELARESVASRMMQKIAPLAVKPVMPKSSGEMSKLRIKLAAAGYRSDTTATFFLASKTILAGAVAIAVAIYFINKGETLQKIAGMVVCGAAAGFWAPSFWLSSSIKKRSEQIRRGLPDSLDLLVITVESGLALDAAIQRVGEEMKNVHPVLSEEFQIATREAQMGIPRAEALGNMAERTQVTEVKSMVAMVNQAEKFGTSIARTLRNQADAMRTKRRQKAEEQAQKTTVKLMAPLIMFIFPAIFVVLVGPAALKLMEMMDGNSGLG